jgi:sirohydrochlorin cobaltochelatase
MVVAGDHAQNDMAVDEEDSWKNMFMAKGYDVECVVEGLAQCEDIRKVYIKHVQKVIDSFN